MTVKDELVSIAERLKEIASSLSTDESTDNELTIDDVRAILVEKSRVSKENQEKIKDILNGYGAKTLSSLNASHYVAVLEEVKKLDG